jgi:hypothetical protein
VPLETVSMYLLKTALAMDPDTSHASHAFVEIVAKMEHSAKTISKSLFAYEHGIDLLVRCICSQCNK